MGCRSMLEVSQFYWWDATLLTWSENDPDWNLFNLKRLLTVVAGPP